jgi:hypothetical protein
MWLTENGGGRGGGVSGAPLVGVSNLLHNIGHDVLDSGSKNGVKMLLNFLVKSNGVGRQHRECGVILA